MNEADWLGRRLIGALRGMLVGDAVGAAGEGYAPEEIEEVYEGPIGELLDPVSLYPELEPDRARGRVGRVSASALAFAAALERGAAGRGEGQGWPIALGMVLPASDAGRVAAAVRGHGGGAAEAALAAAVTAAVDGVLARQAVALAAEAAVAAGDRALARLIVEGAGAAQASGGRLVGPAVAAVASPHAGAAAAVAFALGVAFGASSVRRAVLAAANEGGAASFTAAVSGAICGAVAPGSNVEAWSDEVEQASEVDPERVGRSLLRLRAAWPERPG